jgi:DNA-binding beta-propeller fold protein YncE
MKTSSSQFARRIASGAALAGAFFFLAGISPAQVEIPQVQMEREITARARLFPEVGPGVKSLKRDSSGRYYILTAPGPTVQVYSASGRLVEQIPGSAKAPGAIVYGEDLDVDSSGHVYVADRGANAIKIFDLSGKLTLSIPVASPTSVVALPAGEIAVASLKSQQLVTIYDMSGKDLREFGDLSDLAEHVDLNRFLNIGRLADDPSSHIYYAFTYLPEPTVRKYDRYGYSSYQISLATLDVYPSAQAMRRNISRLDQQDAPPNLQKVIHAIAVDPATDEVWVALGDDLMKFDKNGDRVGRYHTLAPSGEDLTPTAILVEPHRLLLAVDPQGVFDFARPDESAQPKSK